MHTLYQRQKKDKQTFKIVSKNIHVENKEHLPTANTLKTSETPQSFYVLAAKSQ